MNHDIWQEAEAAKFAVMVAAVRHNARKWRWLRRVAGGLSVVYALCAVVTAGAGWHWTALYDMLLCWLAYRTYKQAGRRAAQWRGCYHHGQRSLVETTERSYWHLKQLAKELEAM